MPRAKKATDNKERKVRQSYRLPSKSLRKPKTSVISRDPSTSRNEQADLSQLSCSELLEALDVDDLEYLKVAVEAYRKPGETELPEEIPFSSTRKFILSGNQLQIRMKAAGKRAVGELLQQWGIDDPRQLEELFASAKETFALKQENKELRKFRDEAILSGYDETQNGRPKVEIVNAPGDRKFVKPTLYNLELAERICAFVKEGNSGVDSALMSGIGKDSYYTWLDRYPEFAEMVEQAQAEFKRDNILAVKAGGIRKKTVIDKDGNKETITNGSWQANMTLLERKFPHEFGQGMLIRVQGDDAAVLKRQGLTPMIVWEQVTRQVSLAVTAGVDWLQMTDAINGNMTGNKQALALPGLIIQMGDEEEDKPE